MAYLFQTFIFKAVFTSAQANQIEVNVRDHVHGTAGVVIVPDTGLSTNVPLKTSANIFTDKLAVDKNSGAYSPTVLPTPSLEIDNFGTTAAGRFAGMTFFTRTGDASTSQFTIGAVSHTGGSQSNLIFQAQTGVGTFAEMMRIDNTGNLLVGATSGTDKLHVAGTGLFTDKLSVDKNSGAYSPTVLPTPSLEIDNFGTTAAGRFAGIQFFTRTGDASTSQFTIGAVSHTGGSASNLIFQAQTGAGTFAERMRIDNTGNLLVGATSGTDKLHVAGTGLFTGNLTVRKASAVSIIDATTGNPLLRMQRAAVNSVALDSTATNILNFKNNADAARVSWDLSGTVGKLTLGDVPFARLEKNVAIGSNTSSDTLDVTLPTLVAGEIIAVEYEILSQKSAVAGILSYGIAKTGAGLGTIRFGFSGSTSSNDHYAPASTFITQTVFILGEVTISGEHIMRFSIVGGTTATSQVIKARIRILHA